MFIKHRNEIGDALKANRLNGIGVEIGVFRGEFSNRLLETSKLSLLVSVDSWSNTGNMRQAIQNLNKHGDRSVCIKGRSHIVAPIFRDESLDFIYIDAKHDYQSMKQDLNCWWPKLKKDGLFSGHDYFQHTCNGIVFGVIEAVDEFVEEHSMTVNKTNEHFAPSWYFLKGKSKLLKYL